jgi:hypothetical protein
VTKKRAAPGISSFSRSVPPQMDTLLIANGTPFSVRKNNAALSFRFFVDFD